MSEHALWMAFEAGWKAGISGERWGAPDTVEQAWADFQQRATPPERPLDREGRGT